jgi:metal-responsive CopG/Arc/MetJ family transcriptional regulator
VLAIKAFIAEVAETMQAIKIDIDETLLAQLDADDLVRREGRSALVNRALQAYLQQNLATDISRRYRQAYADTASVDEELDGWTEEGVWPDA